MSDAEERLKEVIAEIFPIGTKRRTNRVICRTCDGLGDVLVKTTAACATCEGMGWTYNKTAEHELICSNCNGDGAITKDDKRSCSECRGRGYHVRIVETPLVRATCSACSGDKVTYEQVPCPDCDETGNDLAKQKCSFCLGTGAIDGWPCSYCLQEGVVPRKKGPLPYDLEVCCDSSEGTGFQVEERACSKCDATGFVKEEVPSVAHDITPKP